MSVKVVCLGTLALAAFIIEALSVTSGSDIDVPDTINPPRFLTGLIPDPAEDPEDPEDPKPYLDPVVPRLALIGEYFLPVPKIVFSPYSIKVCREILRVYTNPPRAKRRSGTRIPTAMEPAVVFPVLTDEFDEGDTLQSEPL